MSQRHRNDLAECVGIGDFVPYNGGKRKSAYEEDQHELKRRHLFARAPPYDPDNHDQK